MTRWAWVIDQTRCIGCHACTTACKSENEVPVGVFRTWVKNVEVGTFPEVKRHFAVLRCNHCAEPPCVDVCPVTAMYQRPDGLVDFDPEVCIGCKACMQACPYDAIYMDPESHTAAKCNFCSHRVDEGLLPACVVVCPEEALLFGDLDDPTSKVHRAVREPREQREQKLAVRRPEQGTRPQAYYVGAHPATLDPLAARHDAAYMWSDRGAHDVRELVPLTRRDAPKEPARVAYDVPRQRTWGWPVSSYIWTKGIAAGLGILAGLSRFVDFGVGTRVMQVFAPPIALVFLAITGALLVGDLKRPERFWTILTRPQWKSWLARGAFIITAYGAALVAWIACVLTGAGGALTALGPVLIVLGALTAAYTAWLFAQCEARDLWQTPLLLLHLLLHAVGAGAAALVIVAIASGAPASGALRGILVVGVLATGLIALADAFGRHRTANGAAAARALTRGSQARLFWTALVIGVLLPVPLVFAGTPGAIIAAFLALAGWWLHGHAFVLAGQGPPIS